MTREGGPGPHLGRFQQPEAVLRAVLESPQSMVIFALDRQYRYLAYNKNHSNGVETQNNGKLDLRLDRILAESRWTLFVLENLIYDEFQA